MVISVGSSIIDQLIIYSAFIRCWRRNGHTMGQYIG